MRAIAVAWTPRINTLHIVCDDCGCNFWVRLDRWRVRCPSCGVRESIDALRNEYVRRTTAVKRYLVFMGDQYYPLGGWEDFQTSFDNEENCFGFIGAQAVRTYDWWQIVDSHTGKIIHSSS